MYGDEKIFKHDDFENWDQEKMLGAGVSRTPPEPHNSRRYLLNEKIGELKAQICETVSLLEDNEYKLVEAESLSEQRGPKQ